jgi:hypothetical protein
MTKLRIVVLLCFGALILLFIVNKWGFSGSTDNYDFSRQYNDSLSFHVVGQIYDVGFTDIVYDRTFTLIKNKKDSLLIPLTATEFLSVYIKFDSIDYHGSKHAVMLIQNYGNPHGKIIDVNEMKIVSNSIGDSVVFDSTHLFLDRFSVELGRDIR